MSFIKVQRMGRYGSLTGIYIPYRIEKVKGVPNCLFLYLHDEGDEYRYPFIGGFYLTEVVRKIGWESNFGTKSALFVSRESISGALTEYYREGLDRLSPVEPDELFTRVEYIKTHREPIIDYNKRIVEEDLKALRDIEKNLENIKEEVMRLYHRLGMKYEG